VGISWSSSAALQGLTIESNAGGAAVAWLASDAAASKHSHPGSLSLTDCTVGANHGWAVTASGQISGGSRAALALELTNVVVSGNDGGGVALDGGAWALTWTGGKAEGNDGVGLAVSGGAAVAVSGLAFVANAGEGCLPRALSLRGW
jgi:hypothetical protein